MSESKYNFIMTDIVQTLCNELQEKLNITYDKARFLVYHSKLYKALEDEQTKMWYFSSHDLLEMLLEEENTGKYTVYRG